MYDEKYATQERELANRETELYKRETELAKRNIDVTKREYEVLKAEHDDKKAKYSESFSINNVHQTVTAKGYVTYPKEAVDEITRLVVGLVEAVDRNRVIKRSLPCGCVDVIRDVDLSVQNALGPVLKFLNSYKVNALEEVPGAKPKDSDKETTVVRRSLTFCDELIEDNYRYFSGKPKVEEAKPKESGEGYITYRKEYVDYLMDVLGDFVTRFENLDVPTWSEQLAHALALLRKDSKVRVTDWEEYKFQWRNGRERLKSTKLQQTLRTEDGEESAKRCGRLQWLGNIADAGGTMSSN